MFHKSASIDPTALIDFGAIVHSGSLVGENVHVGSGSIVGPNVTIGQSTKIGYAQLHSLETVILGVYGMQNMMGQYIINIVVQCLT